LLSPSISLMSRTAISPATAVIADTIRKPTISFVPTLRLSNQPTGESPNERGGRPRWRRPGCEKWSACVEGLPVLLSGIRAPHRTTRALARCIHGRRAREYAIDVEEESHAAVALRDAEYVVGGDLDAEARYVLDFALGDVENLRDAVDE